MERTEEQQMEWEANVFALCLLMPKDIFLEELKKYEFDLGDHKDTEMKQLCKTFGVSQQAVLTRLSMLKPWG